MRKFLTIMTAVAMLFCASACKLDTEQNYIFTYEAEYIFEGEDKNAKEEALTAYLKTFVEAHDGFTAFGTYSDAMDKGLARFQQDIKDLDETQIKELLKTENEWVRLYYIMSGTKTRVWIAYLNWVGKGETPAAE